MPPLPTPVTDAYFAALPPAAAEAFAALDEVALSEQKARMAPWAADKLKEPTTSVRRRARQWERLTVRILQGWPPDGTYLVDEYVNDLETRDSLEDTRAGLPPEAATGFAALLARLDDAFREATDDDGGASIAWRAPEPADGSAARPWWWHRRPADAPWA